MSEHQSDRRQSYETIEKEIIICEHVLGTSTKLIAIDDLQFMTRRDGTQIINKTTKQKKFYPMETFDFGNNDENEKLKEIERNKYFSEFYHRDLISFSLMMMNAVFIKCHLNCMLIALFYDHCKSIEIHSSVLVTVFSRCFFPQ